MPAIEHSRSIHSPPPDASGDLDSFRRYLASLGVHAHPERGFFGPESLAWKLSREPALKLAGLPALLMQVAHPCVAQAVADHSQFRSGPLRRVARTFETVHPIMFGNRDQAIGAALRLRASHARVRGEMPGQSCADNRYNAWDPSLLLWVAATLMELSIAAYELFFEPMSRADKERYYHEAKMFGQLCGVPESLYPATWDEFKAWMNQRMADGTVVVTPAAQHICQSLLSGTWSTRLLAPVNYVMSAMMLPDALATAYGFRRTRTVRIGFRIVVKTVRLLVRAIPYRWRALPMARRRERALQRTNRGTP